MSCRVLFLVEDDWGGVHTMGQTLSQALNPREISFTSVSWRQTSWRELIRLARAHDVILSAHNFGPTYAAVILKWLSGRKVLSWVHGPLMDVLQQARAGWFQRWRLRRWYAHVDRFVCVSRCTQNSLLQFLGRSREADTCVVPNTVLPLVPGAPLHVHVPHAHDDALPPILLAYVGRLSAEKRPGFLLETLRELPSQFQLALIGDGPLREKLVHEGMDLLQAGRLHFLGRHAPSQSLYLPWDFTLLTSRYEGCPMSALESMSLGVPCIGLPIAAMRELYDLDAPYLLARGDTPIALAEAILSAVSLPREQVQHDISRIVQRHTPDAFAKAWQEVLTSC